MDFLFNKNSPQEDADEVLDVDAHISKLKNRQITLRAWKGSLVGGVWMSSVVAITVVVGLLVWKTPGESTSGAFIHDYLFDSAHIPVIVFLLVPVVVTWLGTHLFDTLIENNDGTLLELKQKRSGGHDRIADLEARIAQLEGKKGGSKPTTPRKAKAEEATDAEPSASEPEAATPKTKRRATPKKAATPRSKSPAPKRTPSRRTPAKKKAD